MNKIEALLYKIIERPAVYIGRKNLEGLHLYILGFIHAMRQENIDCNEKIYFRFNEYMAEKYNIKEPVLWYTYLPEICGGDNDKAFDLLMEEMCCYLEKANL